MKNLLKIKKVFKLLCLLLFAVWITSCTQEQDKATVENSNSVTKKNVEDVLAQMKSLGDAQGKIIVFEVENISKEDYKKYFEVIKNSKKVMDFASGTDSSSRKAPEDNYTVTCTWGNGETMVTECGENVGCAGAATWDCLENGGCATICNARITYTPANIKVNQVSKKEAIKSVLQQVIEISNSKNKAVSFSIAYDNEKYWLKKTSEIKEENFDKLRKRPGTFQVDCYGGDGELMWSDTYYSSEDASVGILQCTDTDGGCAEVCEIHARYFQ